MSKWRPTNSKAVKADMITVATKLGAVIAEEMGIVFGVMYDGWTHGTMHFVAVYGQYVFLAEHEDLLHQVNNLMLQLRQPNNAAELFKLTPLRAKKCNVTRWSFIYNMLQRYGAIRPQIRLVEAVEDLVPSTGDHKKLVGLQKHLEKLDSVCKRLQYEATTMSETFRGKRKERQDSYAAQIIQQGGAKRRQVERAAYSSLAAPVPPTSNTCERLFSERKMILMLQRSCMLPVHFEMLMFIRANKDMWDVTSLA
ncbi:hypothetical protein JG688_00008785 [Phytophthora aleatoria]|uniref:HAT C-terminal dimerisation domain-containing protein n=1 Tax=Phytophthora aleatoria TaxID=2496075 RepID=A0A8J5IHD0_9STRA|nr:hypothetical protein JG688_00008785 [Phytophthora aleatoria]